MQVAELKVELHSVCVLYPGDDSLTHIITMTLLLYRPVL